jgi:hypothetical protein
MSRSTARSVYGVARAVSAMMNASRASVMDFPRLRSADLRIAPGREATSEPPCRPPGHFDSQRPDGVGLINHHQDFSVFLKAGEELPQLCFVLRQG